MKTKFLFISLLVLCVATTAVFSTTILLQTPEKVFRESPLIIEGVVKDIRFRPVSNLTTGEAWITISVLKELAGSCPSEITIRRWFVTQDLHFRESEWLPTYSVGEQIIMCLWPSPSGYSTMGFYNGKFGIANGYITGTQISVNAFETEIRDIRAGRRSSFPSELPRQTSSLLQKSLYKMGKVARIQSEGSHLGGEFVTWDFTWNASYLPVQMHYNSANAPASAPDDNTMAGLASTAYNLWTDQYSFLTFQNASAFTTSSGLVRDNFCVIAWLDPHDVGTFAITHLYPNDPENSTFYGPNSNTGVDIQFNPVIGPSVWYFGQTAPSSHTLSQVDFVEVLEHELGHGIGLQHNQTNTSSIMWPYYDERTGPVRGQTDGDLAGRVYQHPVSTLSLSGTIPHSIVLSALSERSISCIGDVTVPSGKSMVLDANLTGGVGFSGYYKLRVEGTLNASGSSSNPVTFQGGGYPGSWYGIEFYNAPSGQYLNYCTVKDASYGISYINTGSVNTNFSSFKNSSYGAYLTNYSSPALISTVFESNTYGVYGDATSVPDLGSGTGYNSFRLNGFYDVYSDYGGTILAHGDWWGACPPSPQVTANVDYSSWLCSDPNPEVVQRTPIAEASASANTAGADDFAAAYQLYVQGDYQNALQLFQALVGKYPDNFTGSQALVFAEHCLENLGRSSEISPYLSNTSTSYPSSSVGRLAAARQVYQCIDQGKYNQAVSQASDVVRQNQDSTLVKFALYDLGTIYWDYLKDTKTGADYYRQLVGAYPNDPLSKSALATLGDSASASQQQLTPTKAVSTELSLENYPNPFNPSTVIRFNVPSDAFVSMKVYDVLGREVETLVNGYRLKGSYQATFDGSRIPSGVYFCRLNVGGKSLVQKMLLTR